MHKMRLEYPMVPETEEMKKKMAKQSSPPSPHANVGPSSKSSQWLGQFQPRNK